MLSLLFIAMVVVILERGWITCLQLPASCHKGVHQNLYSRGQVWNEKRFQGQTVVNWGGRPGGEGLFENWPSVP